MRKKIKKDIKKRGKITVLDRVHEPKGRRSKFEGDWKLN